MLQVLTSADEFAAVRSGLQALGIAVAEDRSGLVFTPLSAIEVWQPWSMRPEWLASINSHGQLTHGVNITH